MISSTSHIDSPMRKVELRIDHLEHERPGDYQFRYLDQQFYDLMEVHDLNTIYIARKEDSNDYNIYLGDNLLEHRVVNPTGPKYVMGLNEHNAYVIYMQVYDAFTNGIRLEEICRYNNPTDAINKLFQYNHIGDHTDTAYKLYTAINSYISGTVGINECIVHIISMLGYKDDPKLQLLTSRAMSYGVKVGDRDLPRLMKRDLRLGKDEICTVYADIYDIFVLYDFFKAYDPIDAEAEILDLSEPVNRLLSMIQ